jgi:dihydroorotate dehydrogenase (fumarate)
MAELSTKYAGLLLRNPIVVGSCSLTNSIEEIKKLESAGAAAVVLKSLFEEEILLEIKENQNLSKKDNLFYSTYSESFDYIDQQIKKEKLDQYLELIHNTKKKVLIPVIASVNCVSSYEWTDFACKIEAADADALELNIFINPFDNSQSNTDEAYGKILKAVSSKVSIPVTVKISHFISKPGSVLDSLANEGAKGIVLFNRFYQTDIDINKEKVVDGSKFSGHEEYLTSLKWIALMSGKLKTDFAASTGIYDGETLVKFLLAGAKAVELVSVLYKNGYSEINNMLSFLEKWMEKKGYGHIDQFNGKLNSSEVQNQVAFDRIQFMRYFGGIE